MTSYSSFLPLRYGVPQGSVLGPQLFTIYSAPIANIARKHNISVHKYADDTQFYKSFEARSPSSLSNACNAMELCVADAKGWMRSNKLKLNDDKTELLFITSKYYQKTIGNPQIQIGSCSINASSSARNLGIMFDNTLSMKAQVSNICKNVHFHLRNINKIRKVLDDNSTASLIHALVTSRLDNGNSLLSGINEGLANKLQVTQNAAARILTRTKKFDHITPILSKLHWLPVRQRIIYKVLVLTWKTLNGTAPEYLRDLLMPYLAMDSLTRNLQTLDESLMLDVPRTSTVLGSRSFSVFAPTMWNTLPVELRNCTSIDCFKKNLKTHLFKEVYNIA